MQRTIGGLFNNKKILVFGGCGFIGTNFINLVFRDSPDASILNFDKLTYSGNRANLNYFDRSLGGNGDFRYEFIQKDIADEEAVLKAIADFNPDYIINFAAETHVDRSIHNGVKSFIDTNIVGVYNILETIKNRKWQGKFVQVSTDEVYGTLDNPHDIPADQMMNGFVGNRFKQTPAKEIVSRMKFHRDSRYEPSSPYSATKAAGDHLCQAYFKTWGVPVIITNCSNNYGPYQHPEKMIPYFYSCLLDGKKIPMYGDGFQMRDWIHVEDHCTALAIALVDGKPGKQYLIGADNERTNLEVAQFMVDIVVRDIKGVYAPEYESYLEMVKDRPGHDRRYAIDSVATQHELLWKPWVTREKFFDKLKETILWYEGNREWVREIISKGVNTHIQK